MHVDTTLSFCDYVDGVWKHVLLLPLKFYTVLLDPLQSLLDQLLSLLNLLLRARRSSLDVVDQLWPFEQVFKSLGSHQLGRMD